MKKTDTEKRDIEKCREEILKILSDYNCILMDPDEGSHVLLYDMDTGETVNALRVG